VYSRIGKNGVILVDCYECDFGINGDSQNKCASGYTFIEPEQAGCVKGKLVESCSKELKKSKRVHILGTGQIVIACGVVNFGLMLLAQWFRN